MVETKKITTTSKTSVADETPQDVPLFLRKTYHMIDSCDPTIACWSDDGETFVVKDPQKFETQIIPQFFKHSKFTSFVRQLNFYSFRKIKYVDTIRLDPKLEAETANFWRFRHENFQRGKPQLLTEIKRMNGHKTSTTAPAKKGAAAAAASSGENSLAMKNELDSLKKRIEEMNKNMTELTSMVQKVTLKPAVPAPGSGSAAIKQEPDADVPVGAKRKKVEVVRPDSVASAPSATTPHAVPNLAMAPPSSKSVQPLPPDMVASTDDLIQPDDMLSTALDFEGALPMDLAVDDPIQLQALGGGTTDVVDKVFNAFSADDALIDLCHGNGIDSTMEDITAAHLLPDPAEDQSKKMSDRRRPRADPELMDRLSEALAVLPKEMQEQIVERLIAAITTTDLFAPKTNVVRQTEDITAKSQEFENEPGEIASTPEVGMPLAAATLAALLSHYSAQVKKHSAASQASANSANKENASRSGVKTIPVIPVHA